MWEAGEKICRRCQGASETLNHVLTVCPAHKPAVIQRHNAIAEHLIKYVPKAWSVAHEQRCANMQPDIIVRNVEQHKAIIIDVKVCSDAPDTFARNQLAMEQKYDRVRRELETQAFAASVHTLQVGVAGSMPRRSRALLARLGMKPKHLRATLRAIVAISLKSSRDIVVSHLVGKTRN